MSKITGKPEKWQVVLTKTAARHLESLDTAAQKRIRRFLHERVECSEDPRRLAKYLKDSDSLYRFRVGQYRLISYTRSRKKFGFLIS